MTQAIVLAGGLGTRLRSAVPDLPKPMAPVAGRPFLEHLLDHWIEQGVRRFVLSVGYRHDVISDHFGCGWHGAAIDYAIEDRPLGTGGALRLAAAQLPDDERFLLLNGDTYFPVALPALRRWAANHDADWCFSLFRQRDDARYLGLATSDDGRISALRGPSQMLANGGVYLVHPRALAGLPADDGQPMSLENDGFPAAFAAGQRFYGFEYPAPFIDIGVPDDWRRAASVVPREALHA